MLIKYKVSEVAKDFNAASAAVIEILSSNLGETKKATSALGEAELNVVFEAFTLETKVQSLDTFFSLNSHHTDDLAAQQTAILEQLKRARELEEAKKREELEKAAQKVKPVPVEEPQKSVAPIPTAPIKKEAPKVVPVPLGRPAANSQQGMRPSAAPSPVKRTESAKTPEVAVNKKPSRKNAAADSERWKLPGTNATANQPAKTKKPFQAQKPTVGARAGGIAAPAEGSVTVGAADTADVKKPAVRTVDTRFSNVNIERYNEKYDNLAQEKVKTENIVKKQKINQKSAQRGRMKSKKETEFERLKRIALERKTKPITVVLPESLTVAELALKLKATAAEVIKKLMQNGMFLSANDNIDYDAASFIAMEFHANVEKEVVVTIEERIIDDSEDKSENLVSRPPVVVVMGHVDHGKTSLLDAIRNTSVTEGEFGGITQHIGAYRVKVQDKIVTFLDTPGHEAFTTMRARGAQVTDIAILVVAADDGIMPQTVEAINHAKAAGVSVIVAINKIDLPGANIEKVKQQLTEYELVPEEWGGDIPCIPVSAKTKEGLDELLEMVTLVAEVKELRANPERSAKGTVIEARIEKGRGPIATILVQNGTLHQGDIIVAGTSVGRIRAMTDEKGMKVTLAGPSEPVEVMGLDEAPAGGDVFNAVNDERLARELVEQRRHDKKEEQFTSQSKVTLENLFDQLKLGSLKELKIVVKADVQGSVEAVRQSLSKITNEEVRVSVIHSGVGPVNESDVMLANASNAIIVGFNVRPEPLAAVAAEGSGVQIKLYNVIYHCIEEITDAMKGMLAPKYREVYLGKAECRNIFRISSVGTIAGSYVLDGKIQRGAGVRVVRDGTVVFEDKIASLRRIKDDVKEVNQSYECGIGLERFNDMKEGDILEAFVIEEYRV
jgi:translation initiation factor IF-2